MNPKFLILLNLNYLGLVSKKMGPLGKLGVENKTMAALELCTTVTALSISKFIFVNKCPSH